ncbi:MAG: hypothetical protein ABJB12_18705 [Pseudomonadota bacterium]
MPAWLNPAGGLRYHTRALLGARRWAPFRAALAGWLAEFEPGVTRAVLVGPSAGYSFPDAFLQRFTSLTVLEPDPIAGFLLTRRLRAIGVARVQLETRDQLIAPLLDASAGLAELLIADPELCLIFGNVLGQTRFLLPETAFERFRSAFRQRLVPLFSGRAWLSFHDRLSGPLAPSFRPPYRAAARLHDAELLRKLYPTEPGRAVELFDHQTEGFFPAALPHAYFDWQIERGQHHLIEAVRANAPGA